MTRSPKKPIGFVNFDITVIDVELVEAAVASDRIKSKQVSDILKLIDPAPERKAECRRAVITAMMTWLSPLSPFKKIKKGAERKLARGALSDLTRARRKLEQLGPGFGDMFDDANGPALRYLERIVSMPPEKPKPDARLQRRLALAAVQLLHDWGRGKSTEERAAKIAAAMFGGKETAMVKHVRQIRRVPSA